MIKGTTEREVVFVPEAAVLPRGEDTFVYVVDGTKAAERRVKLGERSNAEVEVLEGIAANSTVVVAGQQKLRDGTDVEIAPKSARSGEPQPAATSTKTNGRSG